MTFRRTKSASRERTRWASFLRAQAPALDVLGMPFGIYRDKVAFDHWLMHGIHPQDPTRFEARDLSAAARRALRQIVLAYLAAGFPDPGIVVLSASDPAGDGDG